MNYFAVYQSTFKISILNTLYVLIVLSLTSLWLQHYTSMCQSVLEHTLNAETLLMFSVS